MSKQIHLAKFRSKSIKVLWSSEETLGPRRSKICWKNEWFSSTSRFLVFYVVMQTFMRLNEVWIWELSAERKTYRWPFLCPASDPFEVPSVSLDGGCVELIMRVYLLIQLLRNIPIYWPKWFFISVWILCWTFRSQLSFHAERKTGKGRN